MLNYQPLFNIAKQIFQDPDLDTVFRRIAESATELLSCDRASVYLVDDATQELVSRVALGMDSRELRLPIDGGSIAAFCARAGEELLIPDAYADLSSIREGLVFDRSWDQKTGYRTRDMVVMPIKDHPQGKLVGVLQVINRVNQQPWDEESLAMLREFAQLAHSALKNAQRLADMQSMKQLDRLKSEFVNNMLLEIRGPASAVASNAEILASVLNQDKRNELTERMTKQARDIVAMIRALLELSRVQSGEAMGDVITVELSREAEKQLLPLKEMAEERKIELLYRAEEGVVPVRFDTGFIGIVIHNIVDNAIRYSEPGSKVWVGVRKHPKGALLSVRDQGMGIPERELGRIFEEFYRGSNVREAGIPGVGIGLCTVREAVRRFHGEIWAESKPGEGSVVHVLIPGTSPA